LIDIEPIAMLSSETIELRIAFGVTTPRIGSSQSESIEM